MKIRGTLPLLTFIGIAVVFTAGAIPLNHTARLVPLVVLCITSVLLVVATAQECLAWTRQRVESMPRENEALDKNTADANRSVAPLAIDLFWFMGAPTLILFVGLIPGSALFVLLFVTIRAHWPVLHSVVYAATTGILLFAVSHVLPSSQAYNGILLAWFAR